MSWIAEFQASLPAGPVLDSAIMRAEGLQHDGERRRLLQWYRQTAAAAHGDAADRTPEGYA